ncbi:MAG TPA: winged helix-turn-helix domain-containing protein [Xanthomonadales bacterium]|nr:winged helix-turn-helix domain-containing protein [Xanthomonadales bacterium]
MAVAITTAPCLRAVFEFADLTLDTRQHALFREGLRIPLPKLTYELLLALVDTAPRLLSHDELSDRVWHGRLVSPETLSQRILLLRRALGDEVREPRYLRVIRGQGFQLIPAVRVQSDPEPQRPMPSPVRVEQAENFTDIPGDIDLSLPAQPSIVILPFDSDDDGDHRTFARGLTHDIMTRVARTRSFFVIARGTAFKYLPGAHDVRGVSRQLGVRYVVQGNIQFGGSQVRINAALADGIEGREIWAENFNRKLEYVYDAQEEISDLIVGAISAEVDVAERQRALLESPANLDAWSAYHRGCWHMYRFTPEDYEHAQRFFELSIALDPNSSRTFAGLSFVHWQRAFLEISTDRAGETRQALELAQHSVSLNSRDPLGHWALGRAHLLHGDISESLTELTLSTELNPSFAVGQYTLGFALMQTGDTVQGTERADKARRLSPYDPMSFAMIGVRGFSLALTGQYDEAARLMALSVQQPNAHYHMVAMAVVCDVLAGNDKAAKSGRRRLLTARPGYGAVEFLRAFQFQQPDHRKLISEAFRRLARLR